MDYYFAEMNNNNQLIDMPSTQAGVAGHKQFNNNSTLFNYINGNDVVYLFRRPDVNATWNQGWEVVDVFGASLDNHG